MLTELATHYRIVNPNPSDDLIRQRHEAITAFVQILAQPEVLYACVEVAITGFRKTPSDTQVSFARKLGEAIQAAQPSFQPEIAINGLDIRICAGIALGEYVRTRGDSRLDAAALTISAGGCRPLPENHHLRPFLSAMLSLARDSMAAAGEACRTRGELSAAAIQGADLPTALQNANSVIDKLVKSIRRNLSIADEELQILWWVFGGKSLRLGKPFKSLSLPQRILSASGELADHSLLPPIESASQFLLKVLDCDEVLSLRKLIDGCDRQTLECVTKYVKDLSGLVTSHPAVMPLIWLFSRRVESELAGGWEDEFETKTRLPSTLELPASMWAEQIFNEATAAQIISAG